MAGNVSDEVFARMVSQMGIATQPQIEAAKAAQAESARRGVALALPEALIQQGIITPVIRENIFEKLRAQQAGGAQMLGPYQLLRRIGAGGMGTVYLADDIYAGRKAAVKILRKEYADDPVFLARFRREAQATGRLNHANIVSAYTVGEELGLHYYAMEYCDGETLDRILKRRKFIPWDTALEIMIQAARGLQHAHEHNIIHRDIKPANIAICKPLGPSRDREGAEGKPLADARGSEGARGSEDLFPARFVAKILDLGVSKILGQDQPFVTQSGVGLGTPHYLSPEQAQGDKNIDGRTDIYSLGATFYHLVTGVTPFAGSSAAVIMTKHINERPASPCDINHEIPDAVACVILRMMAKKPADRYEDCAELLGDLQLVIEGKTPSAPVIGAAEFEEKGKRSEKRAAGDPELVPLEELPSGKPQSGRIAARGPKGRATAPDEPELVPLEEVPSRKPLYIGASLTGLVLLALIAGLAMIWGGDQPKMPSTELSTSAGIDTEKAQAPKGDPQAAMPDPASATTNPQPAEAHPEEIIVAAKPAREEKPTQDTAGAKATVASPALPPPPLSAPREGTGGGAQPAVQPEALGKLPGPEGRDKDGWVYLFDGKRLTDWTVTAGNPLVEDGAIILAGSAALQRPIPEVNYELRASVWMVEGQRPDDISGGVWFPVDGQVRMHMDGDVHLLEAGKLLAKSRPNKLASGKWQALRLAVLVNTATLEIEGQTAAKCTLAKTAPGNLMLAAGSGTARIAFKDIFVRELGLGARPSSAAQPEAAKLEPETPLK